MGSSILFKDNTLLYESQDAFLSSTTLKEKSIEKLSKDLAVKDFKQHIPLVKQTASQLRLSRVEKTRDSDVHLVITRKLKCIFMKFQSKSAVKIRHYSYAGCFGDDVYMPTVYTNSLFSVGKVLPV